MDAGPKQDLWNILPVIIVLLLGAAYFAVMETAFASASRIRLKAAADHGNRRAEQALYVLDHFDQAITTLLIGTNILHLTIATLVTVAVQRQWGMWAVTAGTLVTTVVVFFAGEMLPKSIAKKYAERLAMRTARSLRFFMVLFKPLSALLTAFGNAVARRVQSEPAVTVTEDELADIIENMTDDGELTAEPCRLPTCRSRASSRRAWTSPPWTWTIPRRRSSPTCASSATAVCPCMPTVLTM